MSRSEKPGKGEASEDPSKTPNVPARHPDTLEATLANAPERAELQRGELDSTLPLGTNAQVGSNTRGQATEGPDGEETLPPSQPTPVPARAASNPAKAAKGGMGATGDTFANRFVLEELLGEGGMGRVYLARDQFVDGRQVALKVLHPKYSKHETFRSLFFKEIKTAQGFVSEHVNQVRDTGQTEDGTLFLTMDLVHGEDLDGLLKRESQVNVRHALDITIQILMALQSGHVKGFVHRDVKPSNVMLANRITKTDDNPYGVGVRLLDFGIAGLAADMEEGQMVGTPNYMSPEQVQGQRLDARSDLFAVGVVLYEMITGMRPFQGKTLAQITSSILEKDMAPMIRDISDLSKPVQAILSKALEKDRDKRFQSADEFITAIEKSSAYQLPRLMPAWAGAALVILTLSSGAAGYFLWDTIQKNDKLATDLAAASLGKVESRQNQSEEHNAQVLRLQGQIAAGVSQINDLNEQLRLLSEQKNEVANTTQDETIDDNKLIAENELLSETVARLDSEIKAITRENQIRLDEMNTLRRTAERQADEIAQQKAKLEEFKDFKEANRPNALIADSFDNKLMPFWSEHKGNSAQQSLRSLGDNPTVGTIAGSGTLNAITDLATQLEICEQNAGETKAQRETRGQAIGKMAALIPSLRDLRDFERLADKWLRIGEDELPEGQSSARMLLITELLNGPEGLLAKAQTIIDSQFQARDNTWNSIQRGSALQSPKAVIALDGEYQSNGFLDKELTRFTKALRTQLVNSGALDHAKLVALESLDEWSQLLAEPRQLGTPKEQQELKLFGFAKQWFGDPSFVGTPEHANLFGSNVVGGVLDWESVLYMAHQMTLDTSAYPAPASGKLLYRISRMDESTVTWRTHTRKGHNEANGKHSWEVALLSYEQDGLTSFPPGKFDYVRSGKVFLRSSVEMLNLDGPQRPELQSVSLTRLPSPPEILVKSFDMDTFQGRLRDNSILCLYQKNAEGVERWFSPRYGLVKESDKRKGTLIELVFGSY